MSRSEREGVEYPPPWAGAFSTDWELPGSQVVPVTTQVIPHGEADAVLAAVCDPGRVAALHGLDLFGLPAPAVFDRLARLAADVIETPIALVSLVDADRQFFIGAHGLPDDLVTCRQTPLEYSICQYAVARRRPLIVNDTRCDPDLASHRAVSDLGVAAYAGIPMITSRDDALGTVCVMDTVPRDWADDQLAFLAHLSDIAVEVMEGSSESGTVIAGVGIR